MSENFQSRYCKKFHCENDEFTFHVLWKIMYPQAVPFARAICLFNKNFFVTDQRIIHQLGVSRSLQEIAQLANDLRQDYRRESRLLRERLRMRISGKRMVELGKTVMVENNGGGERQSADRSRADQSRGK